MFADEVRFLFGRLRTRVLLVALVAIPVVYALVVRVTGAGPKDGPAFLGQVTQNGVFVGLVGMTTLAQAILPLVVAVVAGDTVAGEAELGTLRTLLTAPVGRVRLVVVKLGAVFTFILVTTLTVSIVGLVAGAVLFPLGPVPTAAGAGPPAADALLTGPSLSLTGGITRLILVAVIVAVQLFGFAAAGVFLSTLTRSPLGAIVGTVGLLGLATVLQASVSFLTPVQPWVFNTYWDSYSLLFHDGQSLAKVGRSMGVSVLYTVVFATAAAVRLRRVGVTT